MCFSIEMSATFAVLGFLCAAWAWNETRNKKLVSGILYFTAMETLQVFQYLYIDDCKNPINKILTAIGFLHICFQPLFTHLQTGAFIRKEPKKSVYNVIYKLCVIQALYMLARMVFATDADLLSDACPNTEWLRAHDNEFAMCTFKGNYHLAWSVPLTAPTYFMPSNFIHFFMMFAPFFAIGIDSLYVQGILLCAGGPILSAYITPNLYEQASIWCFMSIMQVCLAVGIGKMTLPHKVWAGEKIRAAERAKEAAAKAS